MLTGRKREHILSLAVPPDSVVENSIESGSQSAFLETTKKGERRWRVLRGSRWLILGPFCCDVDVGVLIEELARTCL